METFAAPELNVPRYTITSASLTAVLAFSASLAASHAPLAAVASSAPARSLPERRLAPRWAERLLHHMPPGTASRPRTATIGVRARAGLHAWSKSLLGKA